MGSLLNSYSDEELRKIISSSQTHAECLRKIGYTSNSGYVLKAYYERIKKSNIDISHIRSKTPIKRTKENVFVEKATCSNAVLRRFYLKENKNYYCSICGQKPEWQGHPLMMILDHINGVHCDNRLENLRWVCPNCNAQLETTNGKIQNQKRDSKLHSEYIKKNQCVDCGKIINEKSTRCKSCENNRRILLSIQQRRQKVERDELKRLIRTTSFLQIGKMFGVTDNTIRKWCKSYSLPYQSSVINSISEEDWNQI